MPATHCNSMLPAIIFKKVKLRGSTVEPLNFWLHAAQACSQGSVMIGFDLLAVEIWFRIGALISGCMQSEIKARAATSVEYQEPWDRAANEQGEVREQGEGLGLQEALLYTIHIKVHHFKNWSIPFVVSVTDLMLFSNLLKVMCEINHTASLTLNYCSNCKWSVAEVQITLVFK